MNAYDKKSNQNGAGEHDDANREADMEGLVADGGTQKLLARLKDPAVRARIKKELATDHPDWENLYYDCGGASGVLLASVEKPELKQFEGKTVEDVA